MNNTRHYTKQSAYITQGLVDIIPLFANVVEPFVGNGDLLPLIKKNNIETYDIDTGTDTLLNPPDYKDKWILTNPPYLAQNKCKDKTLFKKYNADDLYKIFHIFS